MATPWGIDIRPGIEALITQFAWLIDHEDGRGVAELFTAQGSYTLNGGGLDLRGRAEIDQFYQHRRATGPRTSRHLFSNLHLTAGNEAHARGTCVLTLHAANGHPPHTATDPIMVADFDDTYIRNDDGSWQFERREVTTLFGRVPQFATERG
ncbi:nuclear transport factor 2 family protein [Mycobacterium novum]